MKILKFVMYAALFSFAVFYGALMHRNQLPPYVFFKTVFGSVVTNPTIASLVGRSEKVYMEHLEKDVSGLISIKQPQDIFKLRGNLISFLWGGALPSSLPSKVVSDFSDTRYNDISSLDKIDKLIIAMEFELESNVYHFIPKTPNNKVILYHQGHQGDFYNGKEQIMEFLNNGYSVVAFSMPLLGLNNQPVIQSLKLGKIELTNHHRMSFLLPRKGHPIKYFIEPVVTTLNYLEDKFDYSSVSMVGLSGGGWTTTLAAAVDTRITKSFPVAGTYPIYIQSRQEKGWGEYEDIVPELYNTANYLELYILGAYGLDRKQLQILNRYDPCCFTGIESETYKHIVKKRVDQLGSGEYDLFLDDSHRQHMISEVAMSRILNEL